MPSICCSGDSLEVVDDGRRRVQVQVKEPKLTRHLATNIRITRPYVQRKPGRSPDEHEGELPLGILLTGGEKLRAEGLTGNGIKVAVIDSGVDDTHPGFHGKVVQQQWFRWGTPLSV